MIKAVIFDMFETLVSLFKGKTYFGEDIAADMGVTPEVFRGPWHATEDRRTLGKMTIEEGIAEALRSIGLYSEDNVRKIAQKRRNALNDTFSMIPEDSDRLLQSLHDKGIRTGLISNCFSDEADFIRKCRLYPLFDEVMLSYEQGIGKPDPAIYLKMIDKLRVKPEECIYVGDGGSGELFAAKEAGMKPVQALWFRDIMFEPHIPSPVYDEFMYAQTPEDIERITEDLRNAESQAEEPRTSDLKS
ncbi:MAG: HAD-IA family hydrolase [Lachnospiraceae bacterium]|nr:HAD-IA family hydrolase [Lachnospiraceae bacterium]